MIYKMALKDSADEMTFDLLEVPIVDKDIEGAVDNVTLDGNQYTDYLWLKKQFIQKWSILCDDEYTRLRGFYTRQFENADVPSYRLYYGDDIVRNSTLSGEYPQFSVEGVADGTINLTQIDGNIEQTTYTGKNLLQAKMPTTTLNGITCTNNGDGSYTLNGTATAVADFRINQSTAHGEDNLQNYDGTYTLSCNELQNDMQLIIMQNGTWSQLLRMRDSNTPATATFTKNGCFIYVYVAQGKTLSNLRIHPMLEKSATATAYEPYVGGIHAPNPNYPQPIKTVTGSNKITVTGKNILDYVTTFRSGTYSGLIATLNDDGSIRVSGVPTSNYVNIVPVHNITDTLEDGATYSLSASGHDGMLIGQLQRRPKDGGSIQYIDTITGDKTITINKSANDYYAGIMTVGASAWGGGVTITRKFQLEKGSVTSFEPFKGQAHEINLGKNLIEPLMPTTTYNGVTCTNNGDGSFTLNGTATATATWRIEQSTGGGHDNLKPLNGTYTLSCKGVQAGVSLVVTQFNVWQIIGRVQDNETPSTFTTNLNDTLVYIVVTNGTTVNNVTVYPQLEEGSIASSFAPYFEPIELCKIGTYQDRIFKENGKWFLHKEIGEVVFDGSENWSLLNSGSSNFYYNLPVFVTPKDQDIMPVSDCFVGTPITNGNTSVGLWITNAGTIRARKETEQTLANYKTWLSTALPSVYYVLATPTDTEITNEALLEELEALQDEAISVGQHNIYTDTPNALPTLTFDLTEYPSQSTTIIPETAVRLTLTDGGVINACGCRKDVQLTMRETIE